MRVNEIFASINGEICEANQGSLCTFIRLQGCNLKCSYCFGALPGRRVPRIIFTDKMNKKIIDVKVGDKLLTFADNKSLVETTVVRTMQREVDRWLRITIGKTQYFVTEDHPFFTTVGLKKASELLIGDMIYHSNFKDKLSFKMKKVNPMKNELSVQKRRDHTDYIETGKKISSSIQKKKREGSYLSMWEMLDPVKKKEAQKKISDSKKGELNPNWKDDYSLRNYTDLKKRVRDREIVNCERCGRDFSESVYSPGKGKGIGLDVHHKDGDHLNDNLINLEVTCESCHYSEHRIGNNFWKGERVDGKQLVAQNGLEVTEVKLFDRSMYPPSTRPKPLVVYNLTCAPYNTYLENYMWVHNCDTPQARSVAGGTEMSVKQVKEEVKKLGIRNITITGGEPLIQRDEVRKLIKALDPDHYLISIETNGSLKLPQWKDDVYWVVDYKLPYSGETRQMYENNFKRMWYYRDIIKFVVSSYSDFTFALRKVEEFAKDDGPTFAFSPNTSAKNYDNLDMSAEYLCELMLGSAMLRELGAVLSLQLHKIIGVK